MFSGSFAVSLSVLTMCVFDKMPATLLRRSIILVVVVVVASTKSSATCTATATTGFRHVVMWQGMSMNNQLNTRTILGKAMQQTNHSTK